MRTQTTCRRIFARPNRRIAPFALVAGLLLHLPSSLAGQDIEEVLRGLTEGNARLYVQPITRGLGTAMNGGFVSGAGTHRLFEIDVGVRVVAARFTDDDTFFSPILPASVQFAGETFTNPYGDPRPSPTAVGDGSGTVFEPQGTFRDRILAEGADPSDFALRFPEGFDAPIAPFAVLQGTVGLVLGTDLVLRYVPSVDVDPDVGSIEAFGWGLKHSFDQYLFGLPFRLAGYVGWQDFDVGGYLHAESTTYGAVMDVGSGPVRLFGTVGLEESDLDVQYDFQNLLNNPALPVTGTAIAFRESLARTTRYGGGLTLEAGFLRLSAEYARSEFETLSLLLGFALH